MASWKCECGIVNFATDLECKKCKAVRPIDVWIPPTPSPLPEQPDPFFSPMRYCLQCSDFARGPSPACPVCESPWTIAHPVYPVAIPPFQRSIFKEVLAALMVSGCLWIIIGAIVGFVLGALGIWRG